jgi:phosphoserine phosphatase
MSAPAEAPSNLFEKFEYRPTTPAQIGELILAGPDVVALHLDWDGVATDKETGTTWGVMKRHMVSDRHRKLHGSLLEFYGELEEGDELEPLESEVWQTTALSLMVKANEHEIRADAAESIHLRPGVRELFATCEDLGIPTIVKSTGMTAIIDSICDQNGIRPTRIFSNEFTTKNGIITGLGPDLVHSVNKHTFGNIKDLPELEGRKHPIVLGDNHHDARMVRKDEPGVSKVTRIRLDGGRGYVESPKRRKPVTWPVYVEKTLKNFDLVATEGNAFAVTGLIRAIGGQRQAA